MFGRILASVSLNELLQNLQNLQILGLDPSRTLSPLKGLPPGKCCLDLQGSLSRVLQGPLWILMFCWTTARPGPLPEPVPEPSGMLLRRSSRTSQAPGGVNQSFVQSEVNM